MRKEVIWVSIVVLIVVLGLGYFSITGNVVSGEKVVKEISACGALKDSNTRYVLTENVTGITCFSSKDGVSNIEIDCQGHEIKYGDGLLGGAGVEFLEVDDTKVSNCVFIEGAKGSIGLNYLNSNRGLISDNIFKINTGSVLTMGVRVSGNEFKSNKIFLNGTYSPVINLLGETPEDKNDISFNEITGNIGANGIIFSLKSSGYKIFNNTIKISSDVDSESGEVKIFECSANCFKNEIYNNEVEFSQTGSGLLSSSSIVGFDVLGDKNKISKNNLDFLIKSKKSSNTGFIFGTGSSGNVLKSNKLIFSGDDGDYTLGDGFAPAQPQQETPGKTILSIEITPQSTLSLKNGWNIVAFPVDNSITPGQLKTECSFVGDIWGWDTTEGSFITSVQSLEKGKGYYVYTTKACEFDLTPYTLANEITLILEDGENIVASFGSNLKETLKGVEQIFSINSQGKLKVAPVIGSPTEGIRFIWDSSKFQPGTGETDPTTGSLSNKDLRVESKGSLSLIDQEIKDYYFDEDGGIIGIIDSKFGEIIFLENVDGNGVNLFGDNNSDIVFGEGRVFVDSEGSPGLNKKARIILYGDRSFKLNLLKNGVACKKDCTEVSVPIPGDIVFEVDGFSEYSLGVEKVSKKKIKNRLRLKKGKFFGFEIKEKHHNIMVKDIDGEIVSFIIQSDPIEVNLSVGEDESLDLDSDGINDIKVSLLGVEGGEVDFEVEELSVEVDDPLEETPNTNLPQQSPSGGGGSRIRKTVRKTISKVFKLNDADLAKGFIRDLEEDEGFSFFLSGESHNVTLKSVFSKSVILEVRSNPLSVSLSIDEKKSLDLDGDGENDLILGLISIENEKAKILIRELFSSDNSEEISENTISVGEAKDLIDEKKREEKIIDILEISFYIFLVVSFVLLLVLIFLFFVYKKKEPFREPVDISSFEGYGSGVPYSFN